jgi:hypothetical protein
MGDTAQPPQQQKAKPRQSSTGRPRGSSSGAVSVDTEIGGKRATKGSRSRNFVVWEDESLSTSFVSTSKDPVAGAYQKGPAFWKQIHRKWCLLHAAAPLSLKVYAEVRTVDQLYVRWKKHVNKDMGSFIRYLRQVYSDMPTGTPEKEYVRVAAGRYKEAKGKVFRFETCVPILVQLPRFSIGLHKGTRNTSLAVRAAVEDDEEDDNLGSDEDEDEDDNMIDQCCVVDGGGIPTSTTQQRESFSSVVSGATPSSSRFLTAPTYVPPPGRPTGTKKAKAMAAAARASKKRIPPSSQPTPTDVVVAAEIIAKSVLEFKSEIAKLAGSNQEQLKLDEVNTLIRLGMTEEASASMAAFTAEKKRMAALAQPEFVSPEASLLLHPSSVAVVAPSSQRPPLEPDKEVDEKKEEEEEDVSVDLLAETEDVVPVQQDNRGCAALLDEESSKRSSSSSSSLSTFRFRRRPCKKNKQSNPTPTPVPQSVVVDSSAGSPLFPPVPSLQPPLTTNHNPSLVDLLAGSRRLKRKKRRESIVTATSGGRSSNTVLIDQTNHLPPDHVEVCWPKRVEPTQLTEDCESTESGMVVYRGDTQKDYY